MSDWENKQKSFPRGVLRDKKSLSVKIGLSASIN